MAENYSGWFSRGREPPRAHLLGLERGGPTPAWLMRAEPQPSEPPRILGQGFPLCLRGAQTREVKSEAVTAHHPRICINDTAETEYVTADS